MINNRLVVVVDVVISRKRSDNDLGFEDFILKYEFKFSVSHNDHKSFQIKKYASNCKNKITLKREPYKNAARAWKFSVMG